MKKFNISILGIIGILVLVVFASGCTSSDNNTTMANSTKSYASDIVTSGDLNGQWNGPPGEWLVNGNLESKSNSQYSNVTVLLTAYDSKGNVVGNKTTTTNIENGYGGYIQTIIKVKSEPDHVNMTVLNATPV